MEKAVLFPPSGKELVLDHLRQFISRVRAVGGSSEIGEHDDRGPCLRLVTHPAGEARNPAIMTDKPTKVCHPQPVPVWLPQPGSEVHKAQPLLLGGRLLFLSKQPCERLTVPSLPEETCSRII